MKKINFILIFCFLVGLLLFINNCRDKKYSKLNNEYVLLKTQFTELKTTLDIFEKERILEKDSLLSIIESRESDNKRLHYSNDSIKGQIVKIKKKEIVVPKKDTELVIYFNNRYNSLGNKIVQDRIGLDFKTAYNTIYELEEKYYISEILSLKNQIISSQDTIISNLNLDKIDLTTIILSMETEIDKRKELQDLADKNIKSLEKQNKILERNKKLNRLIIPTSFILGGFIGYQIAK